MTHSERNPGVALAVGSALAYCVLNVGVRFLVGDIGVWGILLTRGLAGACAVVLLARLLHKNVLGNKRVLLACIGLVGFLSTVCTTTAISRIPLYQALVLLYLYPPMTVPLGYWINGDRLHARDGWLILAAFIGSLFLVWPDKSDGLTLDIGHFIGLLGAFFYSLAYVLIRRLGDDNNGLEPTFYYSMWSIVGVLFGVMVLGFDTGLASMHAFASGLGLGLLAPAAFIMGYAALRWLAPYKVGVIGTLEVLGGALSSWLIFDDPITARALVGGAIVLFVALKLRQSS